jgi:hypothetical protein
MTVQIVAIVMPLHSFGREERNVHSLMTRKSKGPGKVPSYYEIFGML